MTGGPVGVQIDSIDDVGYESPNFDFIPSGSDDEDRPRVPPTKKRKETRHSQPEKAPRVGASLEDEEALALKLLGR